VKRLQFPSCHRRIAFLALCFLLVFLFLAGGLFYRQIIQHSYFRQKEKRQNQRRIIIPAPRGDIYGRNGRLLVCNRPIFDLHLYFNDIRQEIRKAHAQLIRQSKEQKRAVDYPQLQREARKNVVHRYLDLANALTGRRETIADKTLERHYRESLLLPITILSNLSNQEYIRLVDRLPPQSPLYLATNYYRFYPHKTAACHVLGYVATALENTPHQTDLKTLNFAEKMGKTGIELAQNQSLSGKNGEQIFSVDPSGFRADYIRGEPPKKGRDCTLSIDIDLQIAAENALGDKLGKRHRPGRPLRRSLRPGQ
jgi:penicillin-binding protein 2